MMAGRKMVLWETIVRKAGILPGDSVATKFSKILKKVPRFVLSIAIFSRNFMLSLKPRMRLWRFERRYLASAERGADALPPRCVAPDEHLVVSLTTYGKRLKTVHLAVLSILDQTCPPDKVVLYLDDQTDLSLVPARLRALCGERFEIREGYPDLKPHKKWIYVMREFPDSVVVTIDDDAMYRRDTLQSLVVGHIDNPNCVIARRVDVMARAGNGAFKPYKEWAIECTQITGPSMLILPTGLGGVLYPPHCLPERAFDVEAIRACCPIADDVWLKVAEASVNVPAVYIPNMPSHPYVIPGTQGVALAYVNIEVAKNDVQLQKAMSYFGVTAATFFEGEYGL